MSDEIEARLKELVPTIGPCPLLRERVLKSLQSELASAEKSPAQDTKHPAFFRLLNRAASYSGLAAALLLVAAAGVNCWVYLSLDGRMMAIAGPPGVDQQAAEVANTVTIVTDSQTGEETYDWLLHTRSRQASPTSFAQFKDVFQQVLLLRGI